MMDERGEVVIADATEDYVAVALTEMALCDDQGRWLVQKDYKVRGEVWRVHKFDADPFPSRPHAHCVGGRDRFIGLKLHLGTRELFRGPKSINLYLGQKQFDKLIALIRPKFPDVELPLLSQQA